MTNWRRKPGKRSPLKARPLRLPGQSVESRLRDVVDEGILVPIVVATVLLVLAGMEWLRYYFPFPASPQLYSVIAGIAVIYAAYLFFKAWSEVKRLRLARDGERVVGQYLEALREAGYIVLHDVPGDGFNVDHVLVGPAGVLSVETKTFSKHSDSKVYFDGRTISADGWKPDRDPVVQAKAQAGWLGDLLHESTGRRFQVRPVILFPGWFVEQAPGSSREIWVLNPKALKAFLEAQPSALATEDIKLAGYHLSRYVRTEEAA